MPGKRKPNTKKPANRNSNNKKNSNFRGRGFDQKPFSKQVDIHEIKYTDGITVGELAEKIGRQSSDIIKTLFMEGKMVTINSAMDDEMVELVCIGYDIEPIKVKEREEDSLDVVPSTICPI